MRELIKAHRPGFARPTARLAAAADEGVKAAPQSAFTDSPSTMRGTRGGPSRTAILMLERRS